MCKDVRERNTALGKGWWVNLTLWRLCAAWVLHGVGACSATLQVLLLPSPGSARAVGRSAGMLLGLLYPI